MPLYEVSPHTITVFHEQWKHLIQKSESVLSNTVTRYPVSGEDLRISQLGTANMTKKTNRAGATKQSAIETAVRWLTPSMYEVSMLIDEQDEYLLGSLGTPQDPMRDAHVKAYNRTVDTVIRSSLGAAAVTGEDKSNPSTALPATQIVPVLTTGFTFAKVVQALKIHRLNGLRIENGMFTGVISPQAESDLLSSTDELTNKDYFSKEVLARGSVDGINWMGVDWKVDPDLGTDSDDVERNYIYHKDYVAFGDGMMKSYIDIIPTASHAVQVRTVARMGATRTDEKGVVQIPADRS